MDALHRLEMENRRLRRENTRLKHIASHDKLAFESILNQERTKANLHNERGRYLMLLLGNSPNIVFFLGSSGRIEFCTEYFIAKAGFGNSSLIMGHKLSEVLLPFMDTQNHNTLMRQHNQVHATNETVLIEICLTFGGDRSEFAGMIVPMSADDNAVSGTMLLLHDISDLKRTKEDALAASLAKSAFLSNMSHEIRTPLNAIIGFTAIGRNHSNKKDKDEAFEKIAGASSFLMAIINDVLDISKIESGNAEIAPVDFHFAKMIERVVSVVEGAIKEKNQHFFVKLSPDIPAYLHGDDHRLAQVITNILSNATKFTPEGGEVSLSARAVKKDATHCTLEIVIADTGIGIADDEQDKIFNIFQQAEASTTRKYGGSGLGLSIAKRLLELINGAITVDSEKGEGSVFTVTVCLRIADAHNPQGSSEIEAPAQNYRGKHVLVVDDVDINLEIAAALLESVDITVTQASSGGAAIQCFTNNPAMYDLILMDIQMPEMDGLQATQAIRTSNAENASTIPIVAMTANVFKEDIEKCLRAGMNAHLGKPVDMDAFMRVLEKYLT
ncbi:MAG: ATP-binding protein [Defluviitaleaceae bacterium]|nr:ATP-binding protein [Defluviitaleaceae bacterium]MCL2275273.1 ATP-binding protein [Defluviitaleaceae bacterium]